MTPEGDEFTPPIGGEPVTLPLRNVGGLHRKRVQLPRFAAHGLVVERGELANDDWTGPAVGDAVMQDECQQVDTGAAQQRHPHERAVFEFERFGANVLRCG